MALSSLASIRPVQICVMNLKFVFFGKIATDTAGFAVSSSGERCTPCSTESRIAAPETLEVSLSTSSCQSSTVDDLRVADGSWSIPGLGGTGCAAFVDRIVVYHELVVACSVVGNYLLCQAPPFGLTKRLCPRHKGACPLDVLPGCVPACPRERGT